MGHFYRISLQYLLYQSLGPPSLPSHIGALMQASLELRSLGRNRRHRSIVRSGHTRTLLGLRPSLGVLDVLRLDLGSILALRRRSVAELLRRHRLRDLGLLRNRSTARSARTC